MRMYLAGPMTGVDLYNHPAFNAAALKLRAEGHVVFNPAEYDLQLGIDNTRSLESQGVRLEDVMRHDIEALMKCEGICMLPGWEKSVGANLELAVARAIGLHVRLL